MERDHAADVIRLRDDIDLGLLMAERLAHMGETGSAVRLVDELRTMAAETLDPVPVRRVPEPVAQRPGQGGRRVRRAIAIGSVAAALGIGSAAALVSPQGTSDSSSTGKEVPSSVERRAPAGTMDALTDAGDVGSPALGDAGELAPASETDTQSSAGETGVSPSDDGADSDDGDGARFGLPNELGDPSKYLPDPTLEEPQPILTP